MPFFETSGLCLHFESSDGPADGGGPVLLIHGLGSSTEDWLLQVEALAARRPVAALDLPGFGRSQGFRHWPTVEDYAGAARALCLEIWDRPAHVVGLSLGGLVGLRLTFAETCVRSLVAVGTPLGLRLTPRGWIRGAIRMGAILAGRMDWVARIVAKDLFPRDDQRGLRDEGERRLARNNREGYLRAVVALARARGGIRVEEINRPVLVVAGSADTTVPPAAQIALARRIPGARFAEVADSGHATPVDSAEAFNRIVAGFLDDVEAKDLESAGARE